MIFFLNNDLNLKKKKSVERAWWIKQYSLASMNIHMFDAKFFEKLFSLCSIHDYYMRQICVPYLETWLNCVLNLR